MKTCKQPVYFWILAVTFSATAFLHPQKTAAQTDADLLNFSMLNPLGTARYNAMGGAFGAFGANASVLSTNPAGIGLYTRHEVAVSGGVLGTETNSSYYGNNEYIDNIKAVFPQVSTILSFDIKDDNRIQFGFAANRLKDFNTYWYTRGVNPQSSYMEYLGALNSGYDLTQGNGDLGGMLYDRGLLDRYDMDNNLYAPSFSSLGLSQQHILKERGNITECAFSFGGTWQDKLYYGATIGVPVIDYKQEFSVTESTPDGKVTENHPYDFASVFFQSYTLNQSRRISGNGINLKLGLIYQPLPFMRIGVAFHTPSYYWLKENSDAEIDPTGISYWMHKTDADNNPVLDANGNVIYDRDISKEGERRMAFESDYEISTPAKGILSLGFLIKNFGAVSLEGELINYRGMRLHGDIVDEQNSMRKMVRDNYRIAGVVRAGTEWKVSIVSFRAGYIWQSCPYKNEILQRQWSDHTFTAGVGLALGRYINLDFAFIGNIGKRTNDFYYLVDQTGEALVQPAKINFSKYYYTVTLGIKF